ncbi:MAG TPA: DUF177 domain-containing protein [Flavobacteriaceae bacterium]|nr:DUF177 domain-containing protein [Flavobacteriaceae bacterium]
MKELTQFKIPISGLKQGIHQFTYDIDKTFFTYFDYEEFWDSLLKLDVELTVNSTSLEFALHIVGQVGVHCFVTNEAYMQPVEDTYRLAVRFGDTYNDDLEDILVIPHGSLEVDIKQYVYETIILSVPARLVHPGVEDGSLKSEVKDILDELRVDEPTEGTDDSEEETDPRWDELKKLLTDK